MHCKDEIEEFFKDWPSNKSIKKPQQSQPIFIKQHDKQVVHTFNDQGQVISKPI
jgi:hypothetical protein